MKLLINLTVKKYNGGPKIRIQSKGYVFYSETLTQTGHQLISVDMDNFVLPGSLIIEQFDKDMKRDTKLNNDNNIIEDKGFFINTIQLDNIILKNEIYLFDFITSTGDIIKNNNYFGYNGKLIIDINSTNLSLWYHNLQHKMLNTYNDFNFKNFRQEIFSD